MSRILREPISTHTYTHIFIIILTISRVAKCCLNSPISLIFIILLWVFMGVDWCHLGGARGNRTPVQSFAGFCLTTRPSRHVLTTKREALGFPPYLGAGNEARTRDLNLGKVALYQLSYSRTIFQLPIFGRKSNKSYILPNFI